jgi:hypothetical protein
LALRGIAPRFGTCAVFVVVGIVVALLTLVQLWLVVALVALLIDGVVAPPLMIAV